MCLRSKRLVTKAAIVYLARLISAPRSPKSAIYESKCVKCFTVHWVGYIVIHRAMQRLDSNYKTPMQ